MLLRAASRSLRLTPVQLRPVLGIQFRGFARNNKPGTPQDTRPPPHSIRHSKVAPTAHTIPPSKDGVKAPKSEPEDNEFLEKDNETPYSKVQEEFGSSASSEQKSSEDAPQIPLHDLTKGIPSTIDAELEAANKRYKQEEEGEEAREEAHAARPSSRGRGERQMPASAYQTSGDRRRNKLMGYWLISMATLAVVGTAWMGRNWESAEEEKQHPEAPNGWGFMLFYNRIRDRLGAQLDYYNEPAFPQLLPDSDPVYGRPHTLVLSLEDLLVHSEWSREHGWRMAKRPGVDYFLRYLSQYYEIVVFTSVPSMIAQPVLAKLDPFHIGIMFQLGREAARYKDGKYIKDLSYLNRDLSKVIHIDTVESHVSAQPENAIVLPKWKGDPKDNSLVALIPFLEYTAAMGLDDTRKVLASFKGKDIPTEFALREAQARKRFQQTFEEERSKRPRRSVGGLFGGMLGTKQPGTSDSLDAPIDFVGGFGQGKMIHDQIRERGQKTYEMMEKEIRENGEQWLKDMAAEEEKQRDEQLKGMKAGLTGWFGGSRAPGGQGKEEKKN